MRGWVDRGTSHQRSAMSLHFRLLNQDFGHPAKALNPGQTTMLALHGALALGEVHSDCRCQAG